MSFRVMGASKAIEGYFIDTFNSKSVSVFCGMPGSTNGYIYATYTDSTSKSLWSRVDLLHKSLVDVADNFHYLFYHKK